MEKIQKCFIVFIGIVLLILSIPSRTIYAEAPKTKVETTKEKIERQAKEFNVNPQIMSGTIQCESRYDNDVIGDSGKARGIAQFWKSTFNMFKEKSGMKELRYESEDDQIKLMAWAFSNGYAKHWTCYRLIKSGKYIIQV